MEKKRNLKLTLQYDGTEFHGFQIQPEAITVQKVIETSLSNITGEDIHITGCSRTDAGVHALMYVCNFYTDFPIPSEKLPYVMNNKFKKDKVAIKVLDCCDVHHGFNARFDTLSKTYRYVINNSKDTDIFSRNFEWQYTLNKLDVAKMKKAAKYIVGKHDFKSFMTAGAQVTSTVRCVNYLKITKKGDIITIFINADGYLYNMVRIITGTLADVGSGKIKPDDVKKIIEDKNREKAGQTAPPEGLSLYEVIYQEEADGYKNTKQAEKAEKR